MFYRLRHVCFWCHARSSTCSSSSITWSCYKREKDRKWKAGIRKLPASTTWFRMLRLVVASSGGPTALPYPPLLCLLVRSVLPTYAFRSHSLTGPQKLGPTECIIKAQRGLPGSGTTKAMAARQAIPARATCLTCELR